MSLNRFKTKAPIGSPRAMATEAVDEVLRHGVAGLNPIGVREKYMRFRGFLKEAAEDAGIKVEDEHQMTDEGRLLIVWRTA